MSVSQSGERGWRSGKAATPTLKPPDLRTSETSSWAWVKPPGCGTQGAFGSPGGSPRSASTSRTPASAYWPMMCLSSSAEWPTAVRCATGRSVVWAAMRLVTSIVRSREEPPAP